MRTQGLFLLGLIVLSTAFQSDLFEKHRLHQTHNRNLMDVMVQVEAMIKAGSPFDTIQTLLGGFKNDVNTEQIAHDDLYQRQRGECDGEIGFRTGEVTDATAALRDATGQLTRANRQRAKAQSELATTSEFLIQNKQHLELIFQVRRAQQENFSRAAVSFHDAVKGLEDAIDLANQLGSGAASLAQLADHTGVMMKHAIDLGKTGAYGAVFASIAKISLAQGVDQADVERLVSLLNNLKEQLEDVYAQWVNDNNASVQFYNNQKELFDGNVVRLEAAEKTLTKEVQGLTSQITQQTAISQTQSNKKNRNQKLLDDATALCTTFDDEYNNATSGRRQELKVLAELEQLVKRRENQVNQQ